MTKAQPSIGSARRKAQPERKNETNPKRSARPAKRPGNGAAGASASPEPLSEARRLVLEVFRRYTMSPREMLCFSGPDRLRFARALGDLVERKLLTAEKFAGGYSLTKRGYLAMKAGLDEDL